MTYQYLFIGCKVYGFWSTIGALAEIWSLAAVSWDRYNAVFYPFNEAKRIKIPKVRFDNILINNRLGNLYLKYF